MTTKETITFPFRGDPSLRRPPSKGFQCYETLQVQTAQTESDYDTNDDDNDLEYGQKIMFNCTLPKKNQSLVFSCLEPSCGVLMEDESAAEKEEVDGAMDPFFFDKGYTLAGKTGFQVWPGSRLVVEALAFCKEDNDCQNLIEWQQMVATGARILELGSGVGVVGASLAAAGAQVLLTDLMTLVNHSTQPNLERNSTSLHEGKGLARPLWLPENAVSIHKGWAASTAVDWTIPLEEQIPKSKLECVDLVLASDCVWLVNMMEPLFDSIECVFRSNPRAKLLLSFQRRDPKQESSMFTTVDRVIMAMQERMWTVTCIAWRPIKQQADSEEVFLFEASQTQ